MENFFECLVALGVLFALFYIPAKIKDSIEESKEKELKRKKSSQKSQALSPDLKSTIKPDDTIKLTKDEEIKQTFLATYLAIYESTRDTIIENCSVELLPFLYVVSDIAAVNTEYDRRKMKELIFSQFYRLLGDDARTDVSLDIWFDSRIDLYGEAVRGHDLIGLFFPGNSDVWKKGSAIVRCSVMLGDILLNDDIETIEDYEETPIRLCDISDAMEGSKLIMAIAEAATKYHNTLYKILKEDK